MALLGGGVIYSGCGTRYLGIYDPFLIHFLEGKTSVSAYFPTDSPITALKADHLPRERGGGTNFSNQKAARSIVQLNLERKPLNLTEQVQCTASGKTQMMKATSPISIHSNDNFFILLAFPADTFLTVEKAV